MAAEDYRLLEHPLMKIALALYGSHTLRGGTASLTAKPHADDL